MHEGSFSVRKNTHVMLNSLCLRYFGQMAQSVKHGNIVI